MALHTHKKQKIQIAEETPFDNSTNGFDSEDVQAAIEETRNSSVGSTWSHSFCKKSTAANEWLNNTDDDILSNESPHTVIWKSKLIGLSLTNSNPGADSDVKLYAAEENDGNSPLTKIFQWEIRNCRTARKTNFSPDVILEPGDKLAIFVSDKGTDSKDIVITTYWQVIENNEEESCENWSGDFS